MKKFNVCPRCDCKYFFKRKECNECAFIIFDIPKDNNERIDSWNGVYYSQFNVYKDYEFKTNKYTVIVFYDFNKEEKYTGIYPKNTFGVQFKLFNKKISPKADDLDIDKLLLLI